MLEDFIFSLCINFSLIFSGFVGARGFEHLIYYDGLIIAHFLGYLSHNCISVSDSIGASTLLKSVFVV